MEEIKKENATATEIAGETMNDEELDQVAGGMSLWYQRIDGEYTDPKKGTIVKNGYLVTGDEPLIGEKTTSLWIPKNTWPTWKKMMEHQGHMFFEGDPNPQE